jgi:hypothetical protein
MQHSKLLPNWAKSFGTMLVKSSRQFLLGGAFVLLLALWVRAARSAAAPSSPSGSHQHPRHPKVTPTPVALPSHLRIPDYHRGPEPFLAGETLVYSASWEGVPAAQARIILDRNRAHPDWWTGQMWITTSKVVDPLYRMRDYFREDFNYQSWRPVQIKILQHEKNRQDTWLADFDANRQMVTAVKTNKAGRKWTRRFSGGAPWGPFSGAMIALSQSMAPGDTYVYDVFSGGNRYVFSFKVLDRETITTVLGQFQTLKIEPSVIWMSDGSFRDEATGMTVWVTDDERHLPVRAESAVFIGAVRADLTQVIKANRLPPNTEAANPAAANDPRPDSKPRAPEQRAGQ